MCSFQQLYHDEKTGYVVRCEACGHIQVCFGNMLLTLDETGFANLCAWVSRWAEEQLPDQDESVKAVVIPTPSDGIRLLLNIRELMSLHNMLEFADAELKSLEMMKLFTITE